MRNILGDLKLLNRYLDVIKYFFILIIIYIWQEIAEIKLEVVK